jgi:hypothetical protein
MQYRRYESEGKMPSITTTHRVQEHLLLQRVCVTEDMKGLSLLERLERLDDWARQRNLLKANETLFSQQRSQTNSGKSSVRQAGQSVAAHIVG